MARSTIQDPSPANTATSFERQPPQDLEDTRPFSLLNSLLEGIDGAVRYEPPPLVQPEEESPTETLPSEEEPASAHVDEPAAEVPLEKARPPVDNESPLTEASTASPKESATISGAKTHDEETEPQLSDSKHAPQDLKEPEVVEKPATKVDVVSEDDPTTKVDVVSEDDPTTKVDFISADEPTTKVEPVSEEEPVSKKEPTAKEEVSSDADADSKPLPLSFPKISAELPPPPPPPRPKSRRFSTTTPPFPKRPERSKPGLKGRRSDSQWPKRGFQGEPADKPASFDPINKAIRIFESLSNEPEDETEAPTPSNELPPAPSGPDKSSAQPLTDAKEPEAESVEPTELKPPQSDFPQDIADLDTVKIQLPRSRATQRPPAEPQPKPKPQPQPEPPARPTSAPAPPLAPPAEPPSPPAQETAATLPPAPPAQETAATLPPAPPAQEAAAALPPVPVRRRRRRRVPLNPWTAKRSVPTQDEQERKARGGHIHKTLSDLAEMLESTLLTSPQESPAAEAPTTKVELRQSFSEDKAAPSSRSKTKVKLVPRALSKQDTDDALSATSAEQEAPAIDKPDFEITAPTTLIADDAPISPFTKVARGQVKPQAAPASQESPFKLADSSRVVNQGPVDREKKVFASPFSTALKKRQGSPSEQAPTAKQAPASPAGLRIAPISPPGTHPDQEAALAQGQLPAPTYSFATMGLPSAHGKVPSTVPPEAVTAAPMPAQVPPTSAPVPPGPFSRIQPSPQPEDKETPKLETVTDRAHRPRPEPNTWGILTWILCTVCGVFFLIYLYQIYQTLSNASNSTPNVIRPDQEDVIPAPLLPDSPSATDTTTLSQNPPSEAVEASPPVPQATLSNPIDSLTGFIKSPNEDTRDQYLLEDEDLRDRMAEHYADFPMEATDLRKTVDGGTFADTERSYVVVRTRWENKRETDTYLIKDASGNYRFSWFGFEQSRNQLLRHYTETSWTGWTQFFIEIRPIDPETLPPGSVLDNLYYRITVPEDPEFEAIGYVDGLSSLASDFKDRFPNTSTYQVYADLMRGEPFHDDPRPLFRITRLIRASWDATP